MKMETKPKPIIGVLASHDSYSRNLALASVLDFLAENHHTLLGKYQIVTTRGTYDRVIIGLDKHGRPWPGVKEDTRRFLLDSCNVLRLPGRRNGGVVLFTDLVVKRQMSIVWPFLTATTPHWLMPENLALLRLCDHCHVNRLMNEHSVVEWARKELEPNSSRNIRPCPPVFKVGGLTSKTDSEILPTLRDDGSFAIDWNIVKRTRKVNPNPTLALIAHNEMKSRIEDFVVDYQDELQKFGRIITTGTTGKVVQDVLPHLSDNVRRYKSGPKGGDVEIAAEMIFKRCDVAVFLVDPLSAHPHNEDIKVLFGAAILNSVRLLTNERQARDWMDRTKGDVDACADFAAYYEEKLKQAKSANKVIAE